MPPAPADAARRRRPAAALSIALAAALLLPGCALLLDERPAVERPTYAPPTPRPVNIERLNTGAIFQPGRPMVFSYQGRARPQRIGDTLKIRIAESLSTTNSVKTDTSRENQVASKGPGTNSDSWGLLKGLLNLDASASGSDAYKGSGSSANSSSFSGQLTASVINVLPNGNLLVAGERSAMVRGELTLLRFSGIVDPKDLQDGNVVASSDVAQARFEVAGRGDISETASRNWLQRVLTHTLSVW